MTCEGAGLQAPYPWQWWPDDSASSPSARSIRSRRPGPIRTGTWRYRQIPVHLIGAGLPEYTMLAKRLSDVAFMMCSVRGSWMCTVVSVSIGDRGRVG